MAIYLKKFETISQYNAYTASTEFITPNVSICEDEPTAVHYNPYVEQPQPNNTIIYAASAKLAETTSNKTGGLHTNAFNTTIKSHTFENGVGTIEFNDDVTSIGNYAFYGSSHTSISIPDSVTSIGSNAFNTCTSLTSINIPSGVISIGTLAFQSCSGLTSCTIGSSVTNIGSHAFSGCTSLTSIVIPNSVTSIGSNAFAYCSSLTSIDIPDSVTSIDTYAFYGCSSLQSIRIPESIKHIGDYAFGNSGINNITVFSTNYTTYWDENIVTSDTFRGMKSGGVLHAPYGSDHWGAPFHSWVITDSYYLGYYNWTYVEDQQ